MAGGKLRPYNGAIMTEPTPSQSPCACRNVVAILFAIVALGGLAMGVYIFRQRAADRRPAAAPAAPCPVAASPATPPAPEAPDLSANPNPRDPSFAAPMRLPGLPNLHRINDHFYRGGQPQFDGLQILHERLGVRTLVNLRAELDESADARAAGIAYRQIPTTNWHVSQAQMVEFLRVATDRANWPIFFHCKSGANRAGTMTLVYRLAVEGWSRARALEEMLDGGFGFDGNPAALRQFVQELDVPTLRREAGLPEPTTQEDRP
ncbi:MAG: hypothetical protein BIFFINMI_03643 [Phycisphaerae bacterium]|nr:hypothetical protein [Phycisphaerae bacterium]